MRSFFPFFPLGFDLAIFAAAAAAGARMCKNSLCSCSRWRFFFVDTFWLKPKVLLGQGGLEMDYDAPFFLWLVRRVILVYQDGTKKREVLSHSVKGAGGEVERRHNEICDYTHHDDKKMRLNWNLTGIVHAAGALERCNN